jgi:hypothetical protein
MRLFLVLLTFMLACAQAPGPSDTVRTALEGIKNLDPKVLEQITGTMPDPTFAKAMKSLMSTLEYTVGEAKIEGNKATVPVTMGLRGADAADKRSADITLEQVSGVWKISDEGRIALAGAMFK